MFEGEADRSSVRAGVVVPAAAPGAVSSRTPLLGARPPRPDVRPLKRSTEIAWGLAVATVPLDLFIRTGLGNVNKLFLLAAVGLSVISILWSGQLNDASGWYVAMLFYLSWMLASHLWSIDPDTTLARVIFVGQFVVFPIVMVAAVDPAGVPRLFAWLIGGTTVVSVLLVAGVLGVGPAAESLLTDQARGVIGDSDPNLLADHIAISIIVLVSSWFSDLRPGLFADWRVGTAVGALHVLGLLATQSRGGLVAVLIGLAALVAASGSQQERHRAWKRRAVVLGMAFAGAATLLLVENNSLLERVTRLIDEGGNDSTVAARLSFWDFAWGVFTQHPVGGIGFGTYPRMREMVLGEPTGAHSALFGTLAELGVVGVMLVGLIALASLGVRARGTEAASNRAQRLALLAALLGASLATDLQIKKLFYLMFGMLMLHTLWSRQEAGLVIGSATTPGGPGGPAPDRPDAAGRSSR